MKDKMTAKLQRYILEHHYSTELIAKETGISFLKLTEEARRPLNAEELLQLCAYLHIRPEDVDQLP